MLGRRVKAVTVTVPMVGIRFCVNGQPLYQSSSHEAHFAAMWAGAKEKEWIDVLNGMGFQFRPQPGDILSLEFAPMYEYYDVPVRLTLWERIMEWLED